MLTIEELKNSQVGDWIWVEGLTFGEEGYYGLSAYLRISNPSPNELEDLSYLPFSRGFGTKLERLNYANYGDKWLAFKNKEEADGKSITLPYLLCASNKFACVIWRDKDGKVKKTYTMPIEEAKGVLKEKEKLCNTND